jgi:signal peptidase I
MEEDNREKEEKNKDKESSSDMMEWIKSILIAVVVAVLIKTFIFNSTYVLGNSMQPTLHEKDRLFAMKVPLYFSGPSRGDVIVISAPDDTNKDYIKRIIGIEGDKVEIVDGIVYLNGNILEEPYIAEGSYTQTYDEDTWEVPKGQVFVLGDNRADGASKDSRIFGPVDKDSIKGITGFRYFPFDGRFGKIN